MQLSKKQLEAFRAPYDDKNILEYQAYIEQRYPKAMSQADWREKVREAYMAGRFEGLSSPNDLLTFVVLTVVFDYPLQGSNEFRRVVRAPNVDHRMQMLEFVLRVKPSFWRRGRSPKI